MRNEGEISEAGRRIRTDGDLDLGHVFAARLVTREPVEPRFAAIGSAAGSQPSITLLQNAQVGGVLEGNEGVESFVLPKYKRPVGVVRQQGSRTRRSLSKAG